MPDYSRDIQRRTGFAKGSRKLFAGIAGIFLLAGAGHAGNLASNVGSVVVRAVVLSSMSLDAEPGSTESITLAPSGRTQCVAGCADREPISVTAAWNLSPTAHNSSVELCAYWAGANALTGSSGSIPATDTAIAATFDGTLGLPGSTIEPERLIAMNAGFACGIMNNKAGRQLSSNSSLRLWTLPIDERNAVTYSFPATTNVSLYATPARSASSGTYHGTLNFVLLELQ